MTGSTTTPAAKPAKRKPRKRLVRGKASKTHPANVEAAVRAAKAIELRMEGRQFKEIAEELGYSSKQAAHKAITGALAELRFENAEELRSLELSRLDKMFELPFINAQTGDNFAIASCLRIMERRARIVGLDAPVTTTGKLEHTVAGGVLIVPTPVSEDQWLAAAAKSQDVLDAAEKSVRLDDAP